MICNWQAGRRFEHSNSHTQLYIYASVIPWNLPPQRLRYHNNHHNRPSRYRYKISIMSLAAELSAVYTGFHTNGPAELTKPIKESTADHVANFDFQKAIKAGDTLPPFKLPDAFGKEVSSSTLLAKGPLLLTFYRGEWCPFCNLALRALQKHLSKFEAKGVTLVAITCEVPKQALSTSEKNELKFPVLSDLGNKYAGELGLLFPMPEYMKPVFDTIGVDFKERNGDDSFVLPVPATLLVDQKGVVRNAFVEPEYAKRAEPGTILGWIDQL
ncbi:thioredoxin-like protein [Rhexocercosporidium sp. MPI-PUGE-AT-0058]|nr:thioredoxin-like protein [Rhexocercosporidium sp. MPI-PUGE-AT-0058]